MNLIISAIVGGLIASTVTIGGVQAFRSSSDTKPVSQDRLFEYASE